MNIGFVLDDSLDKVDGVQQYVLTVGHWMRAQGHQVHYLVGQTERTDLANLHSLSRNLQVHFNQNRMSTPLPANKARLRQLLSELELDVLHVQLPYSPLLAGRIVKAANPKTAVVGTFHIIPFSKLEHIASGLLGLWQRRNLRRFDAICCVSRPAQIFARKAFGLKSQVIPNPVDLNLFQAAKRVRRFDDGHINILFLGRLVERKGCKYLLEAIQELHSQRRLNGVRLLVAGKGPLADSLKKYVKQMHLSSHVRFLGFLNEAEKRDYMHTADIAVFPSTGGESFGIVLLEAMAAGSSVVLAGNNAGYSYVMDGRKQQLLDARDTKVFAERLHFFIADGHARRKASAWQRDRVALFDIDVVGRALEKVYVHALDGRVNA